MEFGQTLLAYTAIAAILCLPPALALRLFIRTAQRARRRGIDATRFRLAAVVCAVALLYNCGVVVGTIRTLAARGDLSFALWEGLAVAIAWIAFWVWLFLAIALGRDLGRTSGLR